MLELEPHRAKSLSVQNLNLSTYMCFMSGETVGFGTRTAADERMLEVSWFRMVL